MPVGAKTSGDLYVGILKSRTIFDRIIDKFGLVSVYHKGTKEEARKKLLETFNAHEDKKSGIIFLSVEDKDPKRAADMANTFVDELKNFCGSVAITEAAQRRLFFEEQLKGIRIGLTNAENEVKKFQEATGVLQLNDQAKAVLAGIASIRAQIAAKEVQMKVVRSYSTPQNPDLQKLEEESKGLLVELKKMEAREYKNSDPMMPTSKMTALGIEYIRKIRDLKYYESLFELIAKQYEAAKIDEARDVATIQLLDQAIPPEKIWKPARTQMIVISTICGLFFSLFIAFMAEYIEKLRHDPVREDQLGKFRSMLSGSNK
jgi:capsule polysaccharide export protein KpsE/RkpR